MRIARLVAPLGLLLAAAPPAAVADDAPPPPGRVAKPPRDCISLGRYTTTSIENGRILYQAQGGVWYGNTPPGCAVLRGHIDVAVKAQSPASNALCRGDVITVFDPGSSIVYGGCPLGAFIPYVRAR